MERTRVAVFVLIYIFLFIQKRIYGEEIELKVRPGDNITLYCDRPPVTQYIAWIRNCSHEHQPSLIIDHKTLYEKNFPRFSFLQNSNFNSFDLHITNVTVSDLGLYYCAEYERQFGLIYSYVYHYGNRTTHLSLAVTSESSSTVSPPPVSDHSLCWTLFFSVCPVCVLLSSICVYCICQKKTTGYENSAEMLTVNILKTDLREKHRCEMSKSGKFCLHSEVTYRLLPYANPYTKM